MIRIAICDDEKYIVEYSLTNNISYQIYKYFSGESLASAEIQFDLVFLDIEMNGIDGISTAEMLHRVDMDIHIVFITSYGDYSMQAHRVHSFDFIEKPFKYEDIERVLTDFNKVGSRYESKVIEVRDALSNRTILQKVDEIIYFSVSSKRELFMYTTSGKKVIKGTLKSVLEVLDSNQFFKTHDSFAINLKRVDTVENYYDIYMDNKDIVPLAQRRRQEFKKRIHMYARHISN